MKKKILLGFFFILFSAIVSAQLTEQSMGGSPTTLSTTQGGLMGKLYFVLPKKDTLNNAATSRVGALTIRPQDTLLTDFPPIYVSNGRFWYSVGSAGNGIDSVTVSADSTLYVAYNQGNQIFTFSTLLRHVRAGANVYFTMDVDTLVVNSVTGGTGNGLVSVGGLVLSDSTLYVQHDIVWRISNVLYTRTTDTFYVIPSADSNYYRKDVIYIDSADGSFNYLQGEQDTVVAFPPVVPTGGIIVTIIDVFGPTITQPVPFVISGFWATTGNLGTNSAINYIGTSDSVALRINTKGLPRITISPTGDIAFPEYITGHTGTPIGSLQLDGTGKIIIGATAGGSGTIQEAFSVENGHAILTINDTLDINGTNYREESSAGGSKYTYIYDGGDNSTGVYQSPTFLSIAQQDNAGGTKIASLNLLSGVARIKAQAASGMQVTAYVDSVTVETAANTQLLKITPDGQLHAPQYVSSFFDASPVASLGIDASGAIVKSSPVSAGISKYYQEIIATAGQTTFSFTTVPTTSAGYMVYVNGAAVPKTYYSVSTNDIIFAAGLVDGDSVVLQGIQ